MFVHVIRLVVAAPLVALIGAAMTLSARPAADLTNRDRELVARLTRGGVQRLEADGGHWSADAAGSGDVSPATYLPTSSVAAMIAAPVRTVQAPSQSTRLDTRSLPQPAGRGSGPRARDRAPPRR